MPPIIEVENLKKTFKLKHKPPGFRGSLSSLFNPQFKTAEAVSNISFKVAEGEIVAFIGPNGAGKSTTIKILTGILYPTSGIVSVLGFNPSTHREKLAFQIGSVFGQKPQLWYHLPPQDTYDLFSKIYELDPKEYRERLDFLVNAFEIGDLLQVPVRKMSLGQRMRCEIVASLIHKPKVIFLDEPTIGLDVIAKQKIREVIKFLNEKEKVTIFLTSHDAGDVETLAHRTIVINHGQIIFDDSTEQFKRNYIKKKMIELVLDGGGEGFNFEGGNIIEKDNVSVQIEIPTDKGLLEKLLVYAVENFKIQDINIQDPPMEEIIASIYHDRR